jgi:small neutral amino acid transporter SnatA (MarC family)
MVHRLPLILGLLAGLAMLLLVGPVAVAVALMRSSPEARGPDLAAQLFIAALALAAALLAGFAAWALARLFLRLLGRGPER